ncbi:MAG: DUF5615 family PIN-like protein [Nitrospirae bacterium]|nr:DUF5615 family PIN-like protein [Nitrospirota bacterium]
MADLVFYTNESVSVAVSEGLQRRGVKAVSARDAGNLGLSDEEQLVYASKNNLVIVTHDDDFLSMAMEIEHNGIAYVHQEKYNVGDLIRRLKLLWETTQAENMINHVEFL